MTQPSGSPVHQRRPPPLRCRHRGAAARRVQTRRWLCAQVIGFDVDTLEIILHELNDVVDKFFICEASKTHANGLFKPLLWNVLKNIRLLFFKIGLR